MKLNSTSALPIIISLLLLSTAADAKLIKRGGASEDLGSVTGYYIASENAEQYISEEEAEFLGFPALIQTDPVPFLNRSGADGETDVRCKPSFCEYNFLLGDSLTVLGHSISYGRDDDVTTSFKWTLYQPSFTVDNGFGYLITNGGDEIASWEPTSIIYVADSAQIDVWLDTVFPIELAPGSYQLGLTSTYTAPSGKEFGYLNTNKQAIKKNEQDKDLYLWSALKTGNTYSTSTSRRYNLTLEVNAPNQLSILGIMMGLFLTSRMIFKKQAED
jgi:hypothetical protein